ncbi:oxidoreductase domain protein [Thermoclostridium stercorarium subsp. stercorarium DSM 8532]|uniref:Oxidoreductase domain protein n=3 Tax=Thermoclostridium stercorarium TaxID=1510 RepID=L7VMR0_THES1|nr:inositol 2-dehydrogenase [Thermoclostridium stercorarium]AGC68032.1 oxidoreductase domain protein [Thermoclostridium stercorarium subsp. stercorarium DSM 8532]AGI39063.1 dehydrogenase [Thermoclostridium stercorarium subsp. stercorarium DSM 8532]ANW98427.1 inositol 2-dehydrogenase [Thermoclostridium stercorarium subsp. thermolacticum DSM 2910]ANX00963.1 inositol 2-dehydrogenase [Thermoclostridium stercorarium subsp. leptospartum DSM 9219]UZQ86569.1 inositol 2-dehydrogenase [Thermoclostridium
MSEKVLNLGIIGAGRIGRLHAENIVSCYRNVRLKSVSDLYYENLQDWAKSLGIENLTGNYEDILNDPEIDAVLVCSPTDTHARISIEAARAGKHIFCEKPVDMDPNRIKEVLRQVEQAGVIFQVGFNRRFDKNFRRAYEMIREGKVGDIHVIRITSRDPAPPTPEYIRASGGIFMDMTIHDFDMMRYLSGSEVAEVYATGAAMIDKNIAELGDIDTAAVVLKFKNNAIGIIDNSRKAVYGYDQRIEVFGSKGCVTVSNETDSLAVLSNEEGVWSEKPKYFFLERYKESFIIEIGEFIDSILKGKKPPVGGVDGLNSVLIAMAAKKSYLTRQPVKVEL